MWWDHGELEIIGCGKAAQARDLAPMEDDAVILVVSGPVGKIKEAMNLFGLPVSFKAERELLPIRTPPTTEKE